MTDGRVKEEEQPDDAATLTEGDQGVTSSVTVDGEPVPGTLEETDEFMSEATVSVNGSEPVPLSEFGPGSAAGAESEDMDVTISTNEGSVETTLGQLHDVANTLKLRPPADDHFSGDFMQSEALCELAAEIIEKYEELAFVGEYSYEVVWKRTGGQKGRKAVLGKCTVPTGLTRFYSNEDWVIWIAADHARDCQLNARQIEALLYHELLHCSLGDEPVADPKPSVVGHDIECFLREVEEYGLWMPDLQAAAPVFGRQLAFDPLTGEVRE